MRNTQMTIDHVWTSLIQYVCSCVSTGRASWRSNLAALRNVSLSASVFLMASQYFRKPSRSVSSMSTIFFRMVYSFRLTRSKRPCTMGLGVASKCGYVRECPADCTLSGALFIVFAPNSGFQTGCTATWAMRLLRFAGRARRFRWRAGRCDARQATSLCPLRQLAVLSRQAEYTSCQALSTDPVRCPCETGKMASFRAAYISPP